MADRQNLQLHEEVLLLAIRDEASGFASHLTLNIALSGAILAELLLQGRIRLGGRKGNTVETVNAVSIGDPLTDECLRRIRNARWRTSASTWVQHFAGLRKLTQRVVEPLCRRGILRAEEKRAMLLFRRTVYRTIDPAPKREIVERMHDAIFSADVEVAPRTAVLVSLARNADLLRPAFDKKALRARKQRLEQIADGEAMGQAVKEVVDMATVLSIAAVSSAAVSSGTS